MGGSSGQSSADAVLVDLDGVDLPVRVLESSGVLSDIVDTAPHGAAGIAHGAGRFGKNITGPVTAKGRVNDKLLCLEALRKVARALQVRHRGSERGGIGVAAGKRSGNLAASEEPDLDEGVSPLHCIHTTTRLIERSARAATAPLNNTSDSAGRLATLRGREGASHAVAAPDIASATGVKDHLVCLLQVDTLDDINLAVVGPVLTDGPEGGPCAANATRHVLDIDDIQTLCVVLFRLDPYGLTAGPVGVQGVLVVDTHIEATARSDFDQTRLFSAALVDVRDIAVSWVSCVEEIPVIDETFALPGLCKLVCLRLTSLQGCC